MKQSDTIKRVAAFLIGFTGLTILVYAFSYLGIFNLIFKIFSVDLIEKKLQFNLNIQVILNYSIYITIFMILILLIPKKTLQNFFLEFKNSQKIKEGIAFGVLLVTASLLYGNIIRLIFPISDNQNQEGVNSLILNKPLLATITVAIVGPIVEEFTYRYGLFGSTKKINRILAYVVTILVFSLIHFEFSADPQVLFNELLNLPSYMIAAFILSYAYDTRGLTCSTIAHIFNNAFSVIILLLQQFLSSHAS